MLVNPATVIVLCDIALKKPARAKATCPLCGASVEGSWRAQVASCAVVGAASIPR
jgi:hypothetical protein